MWDFFKGHSHAQRFVTDCPRNWHSIWQQPTQEVWCCILNARDWKIKWVTSLSLYRAFLCCGTTPSAKASQPVGPPFPRRNRGTSLWMPGVKGKWPTCKSHLGPILRAEDFSCLIKQWRSRSQSLLTLQQKASPLKTVYINILFTEVFGPSLSSYFKYNKYINY